MRLQDTSMYQVSLHTSFDVSEEEHQELASVLSEFRKGWPRPALNIMGVDSSSTGDWLSSFWVASHKAREGQHHVLLDFQYGKWAPDEEVPKRRQRSLEGKAIAIRKALDAIGKAFLQCDMHCTVTWHFPVDTVSAIVQLPLLKLDIPNSPFGQVSGIRFAPLDNDVHQFVALDLVGEKDLYLVSYFMLSGGLSSDILERAVERGGYLKGAFVKQKEASGEDT